MTVTTVSMLVPDLPRPEYVSAPEVFLSAIAWRAHEVLVEGPEELLALSYRLDPGRTFKSMEARSTEPVGDLLADWERALEQNEVELPDARDGVLGRGIAASIAGVKAAKAKGQAATPLTPRLALLQNSRGLMGKKNPYNVGLAIERMYALGGGTGSAAQRWIDATRHRLDDDRVLARVDQAVWDGVLPVRVGTISTVSPRVERVDGLLGPDTPFGWFREAWDALTAEHWVEALPARRWVDWATTLLRTAVGFGHLWEAVWLERLAVAVSSGDRIQEAVDRSFVDAMPWLPMDSSVSVRDVAPGLKGTVKRAASVRPVLSEHVAGLEGGAPAEEVLRELAANDDVRSEVQAALTSVGSAGNNTWEAVRYALLVREQSGRFADHYGLLESRGRYLLPAPATEWVVVVASLAADGPGETTTAGVVLRQLRRLGTRPPLSDLVGLLESAGLARGSADADQAVEVRTAF